MNSKPIDILLVEDNPDDVELTLHAFERNQLTERIHVVRDGAEALDFLLGRASAEDHDPASFPKVILLDLKLPLVNGLDVLKKIKRNPTTKKIPVVILTSSNEDRDIEASYRLGANSYLTKPVDFEQFENTMRTVGRYWLLLNRLSFV